MAAFHEELDGGARKKYHRAVISGQRQVASEKRPLLQGLKPFSQQIA